MGLSDPEDLIPGLIITVALLGFAGGLFNYIPYLKTVPFINAVSPVIHNGFVMIANLLTPYINLTSQVMALIIEVLTVIISVIIIIKVGY